MRPTKHLSTAVTMMGEILNSGFVTQCYTDKDVFLRLNDILRPHGHHICYRTFQRYKAAAITFGEQTVEEQEMFDPIFQNLCLTMQRCMLDQKETLYTALMQEEGNGWRKYGWMLERKFPEMNLRKVTQHYLNEEELLEKKLLELDLDNLGIGPSNPVQTASVTEVKTPEEVAMEHYKLEEIIKEIPAEEQKAFTKFWEDSQAFWKHCSPPMKGVKMDTHTINKLLQYSEKEFQSWSRYKEKWMSMND